MVSCIIWGMARSKPERVRAELVPTSAGPSTALVPRQRATNDRVTQLWELFTARRSKTTIRNYTVDLQHFADWREAESIQTALRELWSMDVLDATTVVTRYVHELQSGKLGRRYAGQTINHRIAAIRVITEMAKLFGLCSFELDKIKHVEAKRVRKTEGCGAEDFEKLLAHAKKAYSKASSEKEKMCAARIWSLVTFMHDAGFRRFEALTIEYPKGVDLRKDARVLIRGKKRHDYEWFPINSRVVEALRAFLKHRGPTPGILYIGERLGRPLHPGRVNALLKQLAQDAGVDVTPHGLRHTAATTLLDQTNGNVRAVAEFLRHKGPGIVQAYDDARKKLPKQMGELLEKRHR
jgi:integrase/recombinase XerC